MARRRMMKLLQHCDRPLVGPTCVTLDAVQGEQALFQVVQSMLIIFAACAHIFFPLSVQCH